MKVLVTGSNGTVGVVLCALLRERGDEVVGWDRRVAAPADRGAVERYLEEHSPDAVVHLAVASSPTGVSSEGRLVSVEWSEQLGEWCGANGRRFVFSSTVMVFTDKAVGPFTLESEPDAAEGYGGEKAEAERRVVAANEEAVVARLGWQIGSSPGSNNMVDYLDQKQSSDGVVRASRLFRVATAFLEDTAAGLRWLVDRAGGEARGVYMLEGNRAGHSFFEIARAVSEERHGGRYVVEADESFAQDQRMLDDRVPMGQVVDRLRLPAPAAVE